MITHRYEHGIHAIDTEYHQPLFDAVHLIVEGDRAAFVDCGTAHSVPRLLDALDELGIARANVDWLLLTHVHLDHAGGAGQLLQVLPNARAVLHPRGAPHMIDPRKLIEASVAVYGRDNYDRLYGELLPIDARRAFETQDGQRLQLGKREFEIMHTPGHALHHQAFFDLGSNSIFTGDTFGLSYRALDVDGRAFVVPTTSPSQFDPAQLIDSVRRIAARRPQAAFLTHYARITGLERIAVDLVRMIEAHVQVALAHEALPAAAARKKIRAGIKEIIHGELRRFGSTVAESTAELWLDGDVELNTDGLLAWLARRRRV
ncbi:MAG: MBL fold metallo-hydrolase [Gammaproteobacteria bacterium]|nr:MBL fold metallo-hydrolase [Gammaproteobacteria bacterium]